MGIRVRPKCSWCGIHYAYRYGWDGKNVFILTWDLLTFFWFWWHPHFCSTECKLAYKQHKGPIGILRDIFFIKSIIFFFKGSKGTQVDAPSKESSSPEAKSSKEPVSQEKTESFEDSDEIKYRVFNCGSGTIPMPSLNPDEIQKFQQYLQKAITQSDSDRIKSRSIVNSGPSKEITLLEAEYISSAKEKLIFFLDVSPDETRDYGVALTNIGIHYKFYGEKKCMSWKQLAEEYAIRIDGFLEIVEPNSVMDEDADPVMQINLSQGPRDGDEWLFDVICKGCEIFTGINEIPKNADSKEIEEKRTIEAVEQPEQQEATQNRHQEEPSIMEGKSKERYYYLREENRINIAVKFSERKGFFHRILPASWILTIVFYSFIAFAALMIVTVVIPSENDIITVLASVFFMVVIPITLLIIGIKNRVKYIKEKKRWKECTNSGKKPLDLILAEFKEMENEYTD